MFGVCVYTFLFVKKVIAGESENFAGAREFMESHGIEVIDLNIDECKQLMREFIRNYPLVWKEDIGKI
jgi:creatinine deaminase